ncbi:diguanylate cyclase/phosphodiesterase (GGDEF & EAL domains) with PAS/PAC sensor(s) [hydrothermal vent metagenome]|uniref:Diguanylate cyclase/phosphodiesterase (GGDEF & EAL domains) with PAS/PAC sensor(S) n=1 Tax=hydrothermal vent metagenome TaxID=652676 RepID=A0A3B1B4L6_9ZZZZ
MDGRTCGIALFKYKSGAVRLHSLRGHYLAIAGILAIVILSAAFTAQIYLSRAEAQSRINIKVRNEVIEYSRQIRNAIWQAENMQKAFLLSPLQKYQHAFNTHLESALRNTLALKKISWVQHVGLESDIRQLHSNISTLKQASTELAGIRSRVERLFPANPILQEIMSADNLGFYTAATLGLNEVSNTNIDQSHIKIHELFEACQLEWVRMINNFRLYLLSLSGIFGNPESGLRIHANNIKIQYQQIRHLLEMLNEKEQQGQLGLQGSQSFLDMKHSASEWWAAYNKMKAAHKSGEWRADVPFIKNTISPLYDKIWRHLLLLDRHLEKSFSEDLNNLTHVARSSTYTLWGLVMLLLLAIAASYYYMQRKILQPVSTVTRALRSENWGSENWEQDIKNLRSVQLEETRDLIQAFTATSQKILDRQRQLEYQSTHDALTQLPNRIQLKSHLEKEITRLSPCNLSIGLLLLDLDHFKEINDTLGHQLGDKVLQEVSARLLNCLRKADFTARLGGDEFAMLLSGATISYAEEIAQKIALALQESLEVDHFNLRIGGSIGIAMYPLHGEDPDTLIRCADVAMYESKRRACNYIIYNPDQDPNSISQLSLINDFHNSLEQNKLCLFYQPKINVKTGRVIGFEALLRWQHPEHGFIPPDVLIPLAEKTGMIKDLTRWVLKTAIQQCADWIQNGHELNVAVNLSAWDLQNPQLADYIKSLLEEYAIGPQHLLLEITESAMMADPEYAIETLNLLAAMEIKLAVDDFGTGFSSLSYLKRLPINELKIDKSFVIDMNNNDHDAILVRSTIDLSHNLGLTVVAEGVEDQEILDLLEILGCDKLQGYFISRPMAADQVESWLQSWIIYPTFTRHRALLMTEVS